MLYKHWRDIPTGAWRWPNFDPGERALACSHCGEFYLHTPTMDALQWLREDVGRPIKLNSGHRCAIHNAMVGGAPLSMHRQFACDISLHGHDPIRLYHAAKAAGFKGFGFYQTFLHADMGRPRRWYGTGGQRVWNGLKF